MPIIAVILMLFSQRARVNGPAFLLGWVLALAAVSTVVYVLSHDGNVATSSTAADSVSWGKIVLGVVLLAAGPAQLAQATRRPARSRPCRSGWRPWTRCRPAKAFGLGVLLAGVNPKNLILTAGAAAGVAQLGLSTSDAVVATGGVRRHRQPDHRRSPSSTRWSVASGRGRRSTRPRRG